ncbi:RecBCD enzyme subunit RecB [Candidatus Hartigia pinicola]|nr:RecBCD enzyme subunit RecB [Candidatus Hartigia pinicola]
MNKIPITSKILNPFLLPLQGQRLIEASAGTGKTYTIGILYLRLLLGLGGNNAISKPLKVENILVVTFTEAATNELRRRIRERIHNMRLVCIRKGLGFKIDPEYLTLLEQINTKEQLEVSASLLLTAERQMDKAAIYTIHGFCQRILMNNAFESGVLFEQTIIQDEYTIQKQACADFWRRHFYPLNYSMTKVVLSHWSEPLALLSDVKPFLQGKIPHINTNKNKETFEERHQRLISLIKNVKSSWLNKCSKFEKLITSSNVDKRSYSSHFLPNWLDKILNWAEKDTQDYQLPKEIQRFSQGVLNEKSKNGIGPECIVFRQIDELLAQSFTIKDLIIPLAITELRQSIKHEKYNRNEMGFDDLLTCLRNALQDDNCSYLAKIISQRFPVAIIDEFQDTDTQQYHIFHSIYHQRKNNALLFIGDPKQAIYAFRGADIFTYIQAKKQVRNHYTSITNYRSSEDMIKAVNCIFSHCNNPFIFEQIPFHPVNCVTKNVGKTFFHNKKKVEAITFWLINKDVISVVEYKKIMALKCAEQISQWLESGFQNSTFFQHIDDERILLSASDITILVRTLSEAKLIKNALNQLNIPSLFLSNKDNVFETQEAKDLLWILQAILSPNKAQTLRTALASGIFSLHAKDIDTLNYNEKSWGKLVDEFTEYSVIWHQHGILPMIKVFMRKRNIAKKLLSISEGQRRLIDLMHISELLQEKSLQLEGECTLVQWLKQQIMHPDYQSTTQKIRLENDKNLVQISTIHKSKGLEYKIVWLPFASNFIPQLQAIYHNRTDYKFCLDLTNHEKNLALADKERLAEDLRLLYVALTRAIYHCSVGIAPIIRGNRKKNGKTDVHLSALGYLIQKGQAGNSTLLYDNLKALNSKVINFIIVKLTDSKPLSFNHTDNNELSARQITHVFNDYWRVTSYSELSHSSRDNSYNYSTLSSEQVSSFLAQNINIVPSTAVTSQEIDELIFTQHQFPKGTDSGIFLHHLIKNTNFSKEITNEWLVQQLQENNLNTKWAKMLQEWLKNVFQAPLSNNGLCLSAIQPHNKLHEMQFHIPITPFLDSQSIDQITHNHDPLSASCQPLKFEKVQGILKGFIDLFFLWNDKFYILDYKSNHLGDDAKSYTQEIMYEAMINHRYDLQYQLYSLAIHRYLNQRLMNYSYDNHFGGIYYLFLRGIEQNQSKNGIFFYRPTEIFLDKFDQLFRTVNNNSIQL